MYAWGITLYYSSIVACRVKVTFALSNRINNLLMQVKILILTSYRELGNKWYANAFFAWTIGFWILVLVAWWAIYSFNISRMSISIFYACWNYWLGRAGSCPLRMGKNVIVTSFMTPLEALCFSAKKFLQPSKKKERLLQLHTWLQQLISESWIRCLTELYLNIWTLWSWQLETKLSQHSADLWLSTNSIQMAIHFDMAFLTSKNAIIQ